MSKKAYFFGSLICYIFIVSSAFNKDYVLVTSGCVVLFIASVMRICEAIDGVKKK